MPVEDKKNCSYQHSTIHKPCGRKLYDEKHCIFHSKDIEGKKDKFNDVFWEEFERQNQHEKEYDFEGFVFPGDIIFEEIKFDKNAIFANARFSGGAYFNFARFSGGAYFFEAEFSGEAHFSKARFSGQAYFGFAHLSGNAYFRDARFSGEARFLGAEFSGEANFDGAEFSNYAEFIHIKTEKHNSFKMESTYLYDVLGLFKFIEDNKKKFKYPDMCKHAKPKGKTFTSITEFLPKNFRLTLGEKAVARYPIIGRKIRDDMYLLSFRKKYSKLHFLWWLFADCGRSMLRWTLWAILVALIFAFIFHNCFYLEDHSVFCTKYVNETWSCVSFIYYSVVTFTTLGFGDIVPLKGWLQFWVMLEVILGYIMLGGLISILANKLARRS